MIGPPNALTGGDGLSEGLYALSETIIRESSTVLRAHNFAINDTLTALRELFAKEGIDVETR